ncbi:MAG: Hsp20/alpha crystallin family protein [Chloroflexota bacterium]
MEIKDLIPWKHEEGKLPVRREFEDPFLALRREMNRLFEDFFTSPFNRSFRLSPFFAERERSFGDFLPNIEVSETDKEIKVSAELPGMEIEDIDISLTHNTLTISGEKKAEKEEKGKQYYRLERSYGSFHRSIPLPRGVDEDKVTATFKRGVLTINMPKTKEAQEQVKRIEVKKG